MTASVAVLVRADLDRRQNDPVPGPEPLPRYPAVPAYGVAGSGARPRANAARSTPPDPVRTSGSWAAIALSVVLNLGTLFGVLVLGWPPGNVLLLFWLENAVLGVCTLLKVASAQAPSASSITVNGRAGGSSPALYALFFAVHYGLFCLVHLVFTLIVATMIKIEPTFLALGVPMIMIVIRYTVETWTTWFGRGGLRQRTSAQQAMMQPYPRVIVLHVSILATFGLVVANRAQLPRWTELRERVEPLLSVLPASWQIQGVAVVAVLLLVKTFVDVITTRRTLRPR